jgi:hypothetical protein
MSDVVPQGDIAAQHDEKLGTTNFRMLSREAGYHGKTTLKFIGVWGPGWGFWLDEYEFLALVKVAGALDKVLAG